MRTKKPLESIRKILLFPRGLPNDTKLNSITSRSIPVVHSFSLSIVVKGETSYFCTLKYDEVH
jgi:hypothetical protein